ncbi:MAG: hypothetical protein IPK26_24645 [Planctomycetes bacterium]|nr:hypothetical protein [Planctomycetota bacterium]
MTSRPGSLWEAPLWGLLAFLLYALLRQDVFYKTDGPDLVELLHGHVHGAVPLVHPWHVGYLPLLEELRRGLATIGYQPSLFVLAGLFSALGMAVAVGCFRAGLRRLGIGARRATVATALLAANPGSLLFATVVEFHAPLLGAAGLCFWWTCVLVTRPSWPRAIVLGGFTHGAFLMHSTALFLPVWLLLFLLAWRWPQQTMRRDLALAAVAAAIHGLLFLLMPRVLPEHYGLYADLSAAMAKEGSIRRPQTLDYTGVILLQEWLWPLLPLSLAPLLGPWSAAGRRQLLAMLVGMAPFVYLSVRQLVFEPEYGAYMLPMLLPAAVLVATSLPVAAAIVLATASALGAVWHWAAHEQQHHRAYATLPQTLRQAAGTRPFVALLGRHGEMAIGHARLSPVVPARLLRGEVAPGGEFFWLRVAATSPIGDAEKTAGNLAAMVTMLQQRGVAVLVTDGAIAALRSPNTMAAEENASATLPPDAQLGGPTVLLALQAAFLFEPRADRLVGDMQAPTREPWVFELLPK